MKTLLKLVYLVAAVALIYFVFIPNDGNNDASSAEDDSKVIEMEASPPAGSQDEISEEAKETHEKNLADQKDKQDSSFPEGSEEAKVTRVVDGDTIEVNIDGEEQDVRLLLVDTPETKHPNLPVQDYGPEASQFAKDTLSGEEVHIEYDGPKTDKYGRLLAYIWIDGTTFNKMLLEGGYARYAYVYDPPYTHAEEFQAAEASAKSQNLRIWSEEGYVTKDGFLQKKKVPQSTVPTAGDLEFDPNGPDRNCGDFSSQESAQSFFEAAGGPEKDPHQLDGSDGDGLVCESL